MDFTPDVRGVKTMCPVSPLVGDTNPSLTPPKTTDKRKAANENDTRSAPAWGRTTEIAKGHTFARTVSTKGGGLTWTLNLGGKVAHAANDNPKGFKERMHDRVTKALKASSLGARDFVFSIERTRSGRWHLHGILDATPAERDALEDVLRKVGGTWASTHHRDKQAHSDVLWGPDGWARYIMKDSAATRRLLGTKSVLSVTRGCRERAEAMWMTCRRQAVSQC